MRIFEYNDMLEQFNELGLPPDFNINSLFDSEFILLFIVSRQKRVYIWIGKNTTYRMRFIAVSKAEILRNREAFGYRLITIDEENETSIFQSALGLIEDINKESDDLNPINNEENYADLTIEKILLILEKAKVPKGFERRYVIFNNHLYYYREEREHYFKSDVLSKKLYGLKENVEDGSYLYEGHVPRILFSFDKIVLIEFLKAL